MKKRSNDLFLVKTIYLYFNPRVNRLVATQSENGIGIPFICSPIAKTPIERYSYKMYPSNNLYYILTNGGVELTPEQNEVLQPYREKIIGYGNSKRISNESSAILSREDIHNLLVGLNQYLTNKQLRIMAENAKSSKVEI